jgi:hypothetical protein
MVVLIWLPIVIGSFQVADDFLREDYSHYSKVELNPTSKLLSLDNENEDNDEYDSRVSLLNLVFVLVLLLVLDFAILEMASDKI